MRVWLKQYSTRISSKFGQGSGRFVLIEDGLVNSLEFPYCARALRDPVAPILHGSVLFLGPFPFAPFGPDDPVGLVLGSPLYNHPIQVVKADARFNNEQLRSQIHGSDFFGEEEAPRGCQRKA